MFNYSLKTKIFLIALAIVLIVVIVFLAQQQKSLGRDLYRVGQAKVLATALERYFDKHYAYPVWDKSSLDDIKIISENGINQNGDFVYFTGFSQSIEGAIFFSTLDRYIIEFDLDNSWKLWGVDSSDGGKCRISNNLEMICRSN